MDGCFDAGWMGFAFIAGFGFCLVVQGVVTMVVFALVRRKAGIAS